MAVQLGYRILIVDDDQPIRNVLRIVLEKAGYAVVEANDGQEALAKLEEEDCDLVVSDILMPNIDGYRLCHEMRKHARFGSIPLIFYTGIFTSISDEEMAASLGADKYLRKPAVPAEILRAIGELVGKKRPARSIHSQADGPEFAQKYSAALIRKLEEKNEELSARTRELEASHREIRIMASNLESAREKEALRISREIHDELGQSLTAIAIDVACLQQDVAGTRPSARKTRVENRLEAMSALLAETTRRVQKIASDLRPPILDDLGLSSTLEWLAQDFAGRTGIDCFWRARIETRRLDPQKATATYRIFREVLTNVARHARATRVEMSLAVVDGKLVLETVDNGIGFDAAKGQDRESIGLMGMRERALIVGGEVEIASAPGHGAEVRVRIPLREGEL